MYTATALGQQAKVSHCLFAGVVTVVYIHCAGAAERQLESRANAVPLSSNAFAKVCIYSADGPRHERVKVRVKAKLALSWLNIQSVSSELVRHVLMPTWRQTGRKWKHSIYSLLHCNFVLYSTV